MGTDTVLEFLLGMLFVIVLTFLSTTSELTVYVLYDLDLHTAGAIKAISTNLRSTKNQVADR